MTLMLRKKRKMMTTMMMKTTTMMVVKEMVTAMKRTKKGKVERVQAMVKTTRML